MAGAYDSLWESKRAKNDWWTLKATDDQKEWLQGLIEEIRSRGKEPVWATVHAAFCELWPDDPPVVSTLAEAVRKRL